MTTPTRNDVLVSAVPGLTAAAPMASALGVATLGAMLILITAFAPLSAIHNAAHDSRHSYAVPCH
jgi:cobalt transporter subunit CbtB